MFSSDFGISYAGLIKLVEKYFLFFYFLFVLFLFNRSYKIGIVFLNIWKILPAKVSGPEFCSGLVFF